MATKKAGKKRLSAIFSRSKICGFFMKTASYLFSKAESSITGKVFSSYDDEAFTNGALGGLVEKSNVDKRVFKPLKNNISKYVSQSYLLNVINQYLSGFLNTKLNVYGLLFITVGIGFLLVEAMKVYSFGASAMTFTDMFISVLLMIVSVPLLFSSETLDSALVKSRFVDKILFDWLGCKRRTIENNTTAGHTKTALPLGIMLCIVSWWVRPLHLIAFLVVLVVAIAVFYSPESGVVGMLFCIPFMSSKALNYIILYIAVSYFCKYIRGKRTLKFGPLGVAVMMYAVFVLFNYMTSVSFIQSRDKTVDLIFSIIAFFLVVNLIKSKKWVTRCIKSMCISCFLVSVYGIVRYISSHIGFDYINFVFESTASEKMVSCFAEPKIFSQYILMVMPFVMYGLRRDNNGKKVSSFLTFILCALCMFFTYDYRAWICIVISFVLLFMMYDKKTLSFVLFASVLSVLVLLNLPLSELAEASVLSKMSAFVENSFVSIVSGTKIHSLPILSGTGIGTFDYIYKSIDYANASFGYRMIVELGFAGALMFIAVLFLCLQKNTTVYTNGCTKEGKLLSLISLASIAGLLLRGVDTNIFADYRIILMFWICLGLSSCIAGNERQSVNIADMNIYE